MATHQVQGRDEISERDPDWTNWNDHDPGVTLVAMFAFLAVGLLWLSAPQKRRSGLSRLIAAGLGVAGAAWLVRQCHRRD